MSNNLHFDWPAALRRTAPKVWLVLMLALGASAIASTTEGTEAPAPAGPDRQAFDVADVVIDGQRIMQVRGTASYPAKRRAAEIAEQIILVAKDPSIPTDAVVIREEGGRSLLLAGDTWLLDVVDADAEIEGLGRALLADVHRDRIKEVIASYRHDRRPDVLVEKTGYALAATLAAAVLILFFWWVFRRLADILDRRLQTQIRQLEAKSARLIRSRNITRLLRGLTRVVFLALVILTLYFSINYVLGLYPWTRGVSDWLFSLILNPLKEIGRGLLATVPDLIWLVILFFITRYLLDMIRTFFRGIETGAIKLASLDRELAMPTYRIVRVVVIIFAVVMAYPHIPGSDSAAFQGLSVLIGLIISLGSQSIIGNIIAGYSLLYRRPFRIGDRIRINDITGEVTELRVLTTRLRSLKNEEVVIPNTTVLNGDVINYSTLARDWGLILHTTVGIGYETPWRQVEAMLKQAAERTGGLLNKPKPFVLQKALGDFAVTYEINAHCADPANMAHILSALHRNILDVFNEHGVAIMTPSYIADPPEPKLVPLEQWYAPPAAAPTNGDRR